MNSGAVAASAIMGESPDLDSLAVVAGHPSDIGRADEQLRSLRLRISNRGIAPWLRSRFEPVGLDH
jgi:hypothetical protein